MIQRLHTKPASPASRRWTLDEYYHLGELGFFDDQRVELIDGEIIEMAPQKDVHAVAVGLVFKAMSKAFGDGPLARCRLPLPPPDRRYVGAVWLDLCRTDNS